MGLDSINIVMCCLKSKKQFKQQGIAFHTRFLLTHDEQSFPSVQISPQSLFTEHVQQSSQTKLFLYSSCIKRVVNFTELVLRLLVIVFLLFPKLLQLKLEQFPAFCILSVNSARPVAEITFFHHLVSSFHTGLVQVLLKCKQNLQRTQRTCQ